MVPSRATLAYEMVLVLFALLSVGLLVFELTSVLSTEYMGIIFLLDLVICAVFFGDFCWGLYRSVDRRRYFRAHWYELFAAIPLTDQVVRSFRVLRLLRLLQILRMVRVLVRLKIISHVLDELGFRLFSLGVVMFVLVFSSAVFFFVAEQGVNPMVTHFFDAFWWAIVTVTTIGYGDIYPVTTEGRLVAIFLMLSGLGVLGALTAMISSHVFRLNQLNQQHTHNEK